MANIEQNEQRGNKFENMTDDELRQRISPEYITENSPTTGNPEQEAFDQETADAKLELQRRGL